MPKQKHKPVLLEETIRLLNPSLGNSYFDGTAGYGGHASEILKRIGPASRATLVDRDPDSFAYLQAHFGAIAEIIHDNYLNVARKLVDAGVQYDMVLLDLGVSSPQLDTPERGFSFKAKADLDMRMDTTQPLSAWQVVNEYPQGRLEQLLREFGDERRSRAVARTIVAHRPVDDTVTLAQLVRSVVRGSPGDIDAATRTFQAIRIEVNDELGSLRAALPILAQLLAPGGRLAVISFHSLEDRIVKEFMNLESRDCICPPKQPVCTCSHRASLRKLTPKAIKGSESDAINPRARSAKLRAAEKINKNQKE